MKKITNKTLMVIVAASLAAGGVSATAYAKSNSDTTKISSETETETEETKEKNNDSLISDEEISDSDMIYVMTETNGRVKQIIADDAVKTKLQAKSDADDVSNLPVTMEITYKLDGKTVTAEELAGKSGHVTIRYSFKNNKTQFVEVNGKKEKMYVPFTVVTGIIMDNDTFSNIEVSTGKVINDGTRSVVAGLAFPGLQTDLNVDSDKFEIPDYVEVSADTKNCELSNTWALVTNEVFSNIETKDIDSVEDLKDSVNQLSDATNQLMDGSNQLYDGLTTLLDKSKELTDGTNKLAVGSTTLKDGVSALDNGASQLYAGSGELVKGLQTIDSNSAALVAGAQQTFNALLTTANTQIAASGLEVPALSIDNYGTVLGAAINSLDANNVYAAAEAQVAAAVEAQRDNIRAKVTEVVRAQVEQQVKAEVTNGVRAQVEQQVRANEAQFEAGVLQAMGMTKEQYDLAVAAGAIDETTQQQIQGAVETAIQAKIEETMASDDIQTKIDSMVPGYLDEQMAGETVQATIDQYTENEVQKAISENMAGDEVQAKLKAAADGAQSLISLKASLDSYNAFYLGVIGYTQAVGSAADGAANLRDSIGTLKDGSEKVLKGAGELDDGIQKLNNKTPELVDGVTKLHDGAGTLSDGLKKFDQDGIEKLVSAANDDVEGFINRVKDIVDLSKNYRDFSDAGNTSDSQYKYIYRVDDIKEK